MQKSFVAAAALAAFVAVGCAENKPAPQAVASPTPVVEKAKAVAVSSYVVKKGDSLWKIAGSEKVMGDPFRWPLLFKENRDQIQDPDFIEPNADLSFKVTYTADEIADAVQKAKETPKFVPRKHPRKVLPIQY
jgi:nucleoid-associated protein YgaU